MKITPSFLNVALHTATLPQKLHLPPCPTVGTILVSPFENEGVNNYMSDCY